MKTQNTGLLLCALGLIFVTFQNCSPSAFRSSAVFSTAQGSPAEEAVLLPKPEDVPISSCMNYDNKNSNLTWCGSYEMMAHLALYRSNRDPRHLLDFVVYSQKVIGKRDDHLGFSQRKKVWSQTNFTEGVPYPTLVGDGMITYPLADFAAIVLLEEPALGRIVVTSDSLRVSLGDLAREYLSDVQQNIAEHAPEWNASLGGYQALPETANYFKDIYGRSMSDWIELPFNMSMAMGRTLITVYRLTRDPDARAKIEKLVSRWRMFRTVSEGFVLWPYSTTAPEIAEDVSHAAIDVDFLRLSYEHGVGGVKRAELVEIGRAFSGKMYYSKAGIVSYLVSGDVRNTPQETFTTYVDSMSWLTVSSYDEELKRVAIDASRLAPAPVQGYAQWGFAMMREFGGQTLLGERCQLDSECFSNRCNPTAHVCLPR